MSDHAQRTYDYCLHFFVELRALGVHRAVVSPGSRSAPLAISARAAGLAVTVHLDERVAGFHALGHAEATGMPAVAICTSGTAGANYLPAVTEAHHRGVPLLVCTADRPPELRGWGAGQTIDQASLYGPRLRWFQELPVPSEVPATSATAVAVRAVASAVHHHGPVHLNWPFREPLEPDGPLAVPSPTREPLPTAASSPPSSRLGALATTYERGLVVVGPVRLPDLARAQILGFASQSGWPVLADPASGLRNGAGPVITTGELLLASRAFLDTLDRPDVVIGVGGAPVSKAYRLWMERAAPTHLVLVDPGVEWPDPTGSVTEVIPGPVSGLFDLRDLGPRTSEWGERWRQADDAATETVAGLLDTDDSELALTARLVSALTATGERSTLVVSNSMPVRDLDVALRSAPGVRIVANRGASGIDGVISMAAGIAEAEPDQSVVVLVGDVAAVHDLGGIAGAGRLASTNLTVVVIDNDGGGIFSFLPVARAVESGVFRDLFTTPHGTDVAGAARALGFAVHQIGQGTDLGALLDRSGARQPRLLVFPTDPDTTLRSMALLRDAVDEALGAG